MYLRVVLRLKIARTRFTVHLRCTRLITRVGTVTSGVGNIRSTLLYGHVRDHHGTSLTICKQHIFSCSRCFKQRRSSTRGQVTKRGLKGQQLFGRVIGLRGILFGQDCIRNTMFQGILAQGLLRACGTIARLFMGINGLFYGKVLYISGVVAMRGHGQLITSGTLNTVCDIHGTLDLLLAFGVGVNSIQTHGRTLMRIALYHITLGIFFGLG